MNRAFPYRSDCPISSIPAVEGSLIESCEISSVPNPVWSVPLMPQFPTHPFDFGCFEWPKPSTILSSSNMISLAAWITYPSGSETNCCEPLFNFLFQTAPAGCPALDNTEKITRPKDEQPPEMVITTTPVGEDCAYNLGFDLQLPCVPFIFNTELRMSFTNELISSGSYTYQWCSCSLSDGSSVAPQECTYDVDFSFRLPQPELNMNVTVGSTGDSTDPDPCNHESPEYEKDLRNYLLVSDIDLRIVPAVNPNDPASLVLTATKRGPWWACTIDSTFTMAAIIDPCEFYGFEDEDLWDIWSDEKISIDPACPLKVTWDLKEINKYKVDQTQTNATTNADPVNPNTIYDMFYGFNSVEEDNDCGQYLDDNSEFWIPKDMWVVHDSHAPGYYVGGTFNGQIASLAVLANVESTVFDPDVEDQARQISRIDTYYKTMRPFVKGGLTGCYKPVPGIYWYFERGILASASEGGA